MTGSGLVPARTRARSAGKSTHNSATAARKGYRGWLFVGQTTASVGFVIYRWLLKNRVFVTTNVLIMSRLFGQWIYVHNKRRQRVARAR